MNNGDFGFIYRNDQGNLTLRTISNDSISEPIDTGEKARELDSYTILAIDSLEHDKNDSAVIHICMQDHGKNPDKSTLTSEQFLNHLSENPGKRLKLYQYLLNNYHLVYDERMIDVPLKVALVDKIDPLGVGVYLDIDHNKLQ